MGDTRDVSQIAAMQAAASGARSKRGMMPNRRRFIRRLVVPALVAMSMYGGFLVGEKLGMFAGVYRLLQIHAPGVVEIADSVRAMPSLTERMVEALARYRSVCVDRSSLPGGTPSSEIVRAAHPMAQDARRAPTLPPPRPAQPFTMPAPQER